MVLGTKLLCLVVAGVVGRTPPAAGSPLVSDVALQQAGFIKFWEAQVPLAAGDSIRDAYLVDEALYITSELGSIFSLQADVGLVRWGTKLTEADYRIYPPGHIQRSGGAGPVVIPTTTAIIILDRFLGDLKYRFHPGMAIGSPAAGVDNTLFMGGADGNFYALSFSPLLPNQLMKRWEVYAGGPVTAAPLIYAGDALVFASLSGKVFSCRASDKSFRWSFRTQGAINGDPAVDDSGVYVASADRSLYKMDREDGRLHWRARFPRPLTEGPFVTAQMVYQFCQGHGLTALDAVTGQEKWRVEDGRMLAAHTSGGDIVMTTTNLLRVVHHEHGEILATVEAPSVFKAVSNTRDGSVYLLGRDGRVLCVRLDDVPYLRQQQVMAARQQLNRPPVDESKSADRLPKPFVSTPDPTEEDPLRSKKDITP